jgi:hypothetical protein
MSMNSLSSARFAPPQQARLNPQVAQQRSGVQIRPEDAQRLAPEIEKMFKALSDNLKVQALDDSSIDRKALLAGLRGQWKAFTETPNGFFLTEVEHFPDFKSYQLTLSTHPSPEAHVLSEAKVHVGESLRTKQFDARDRQLTSITTAQGQELPASPKLNVRHSGAALYPHFSLTNPKETKTALDNTQAVINVFNKAIED